MMEELAQYLPSLCQFENGPTDDFYCGSPSSSSVGTGTGGGRGLVEEDDLNALSEGVELFECVMKYILDRGGSRDMVTDMITNKIKDMTGKLTGIREKYKVSMEWLQVVENKMIQMGEEIRKLRKRVRELEKDAEKDCEEEGPAAPTLPAVMKWNRDTMSWREENSALERARAATEGGEGPLDLTSTSTSTIVVDSTTSPPNEQACLVPNHTFLSNSGIRETVEMVAAKATEKRSVGVSESERDSESSEDESEAPSEEASGSHGEQMEMADDEAEIDAENDLSTEDSEEEEEDFENDDEPDPDQDDSYTYVPSTPVSPPTLKRQSDRRRVPRKVKSLVSVPVVKKKSAQTQDVIAASGSQSTSLNSPSGSSPAATPTVKVPGRRRGKGKKPKMLPPFYCPICKKKFGWKHGLKGHMKLHQPREKTVKCPTCSKAFHDDKHLQSHMITHLEKHIPCSICSQLFKSKYAIRLHMKVHSNQRPFHCQICDKRFKRRPELKEHQITHTGQRAHSCSICDKRFIQRSHLRSHLRTHGGPGERKHKCKGCGASFLAKGNWRRHIRQCISFKRSVPALTSLQNEN